MICRFAKFRFLVSIALRIIWTIYARMLQWTHIILSLANARCPFWCRWIFISRWCTRILVYALRNHLGPIYVKLIIYNRIICINKFENKNRPGHYNAFGVLVIYTKAFWSYTFSNLKGDLYRYRNALVKRIICSLLLYWLHVYYAADLTNASAIVRTFENVEKWLKHLSGRLQIFSVL